MALSAGTRLGPYEILARIGAGGMGEVYKARDTRLDRVVAVKVAKAQFTERFEREARAVAALNHPNISTLYDIGPNYLVMEFIEGAPIKAPLPLDRAFPLAIQIVDALDAAHTKGVVHRDLKPGNVLITREGRVKILDFGLALMASLPARTEDETLTMPITDPGTTVGTVAYMSPEQARGQPLDARTDLWSFGVMLYELATGARPFQGATTATTFESILNQAPAPVHERNPKIPAELERIVDRLLEKDREIRYQSAADLRADLKRAERDSSGVSIAAAPPKRAKWKIGIAALGAVLLAAAGGFYLWQRAHAAPLTDKDVLVLADFTNTTGDPVFDGTLREALAVGLEESPFLKIMDDQEAAQTLQLMGRSTKDRITNDIAHEICIRTGEKATIGGAIASLGKTYAITLLAANCQTGATLAREQVEAEDKEHVLKAVGAGAAAVRAKLGESLRSIQTNDPFGGGRQLTTTSLEAFQAYAQGYERAIQGSSREAIPFFQRATELDPNFASAYRIEGIQYGNLGQVQRREELLKKAFGLIDRVSERERLDILGNYYWRVTGELDKAIDIFQQEARSYPHWWGPPNALGIIYPQMGDQEKGLQEDQEALRLVPGILSYGNVIVAFRRLGRFDEAKAVAEQAFARKLDAPLIHSELLRIAYDQGDLAAAQKEIEWFAGRPEEFQALGIQAANARTQGQLRKAESLLQQSAELRRRGLKAPAGIEQAAAFVQADLGNCGPLRALGFARVVPPIADNPVAAVGTETTFAQCGETAPAERLAEEAARLRPLDTLLNGLYLPELRAAIEMGRNEPEKAIEFLKPARQYERGDPYAIHQRGLAFLQAKKGPEAEAEFQKILDLKNPFASGLLRPLSYVGLARSATLAGDHVKAKKAYQDFFALWKDADADIPVLMEARKEYAALQ
ncbi:MAG TPA: protein kinase [Bryobacteraceae bacterium]